MRVWIFSNPVCILNEADWLVPVVHILVFYGQSEPLFQLRMIFRPFRSLKFASLLQGLVEVVPVEVEGMADPCDVDD